MLMSREARFREFSRLIVPPSIADMEVGQIWEQLKTSMEDLRTTSPAAVQTRAYLLVATA